MRGLLELHLLPTGIAIESINPKVQFPALCWVTKFINSKLRVEGARGKV